MDQSRAVALGRYGDARELDGIDVSVKRKEKEP